MSYIIFSSLFCIVLFFVFIAAFFRLKYLAKINDYWNKGASNANTFTARIKRLSTKIAAALGALIVTIFFATNLFVALPLELKGLKYGISGEELQSLKWKHEEFSNSSFDVFVDDYKKFGQADVYDFVEARRLNIASYSAFVKHKETIRQIELEEKKAKLELERKQKEAKLAEERKAIEAERKLTTKIMSGGYGPSSGTVTSIDTSTGNVSISGYSRVTVGKSTSVTVNGSQVRNEGDLMVGDKCTVRMESTDLYARNLVCSR